MQPDTPAQPARCVACHHTLHPTETHRWACTGCTQQCGTHLAELPELYAALDARPGATAPLTGSRHTTASSQPPGSLHVMDLTDPRGAIRTTLTGWMRDWAEHGAGALPAWPADDRRQVATACRWLRWRLDWAAHSHEPAGEALREIASAHSAVHAAATGERGERTVLRLCPCGGAVPFRASSTVCRCQACGQQYGRAETTHLPAAPRHATAA